MRLEKFVTKNGKKLRYGYTTGSCAAAASKGAAWMLVHQQLLAAVRLQTPKGWELTLELEDSRFTRQEASCAVTKDGGDDPDATHGLAVYSRVSWREDQEIVITGGEGVGRVTKKGLPVAIGQAAINPVPLEMIRDALREVIGPDRGIQVEISVPGGQQVALRTFNPRLGIVGGISILGTTGIVEPMSEEAFKESLAIELGVLAADGNRKLIFVPGNYGRDLARSQFGIKEEHIFKYSNFIGYLLDQAVEKGLEEILLIGHIGKIVKVAGGIFHTHSHVADGKMEIMTAYLALMGAPLELLELVMYSNTTEEAVAWINRYGYQGLYVKLAEKVTEKCRQRTGGSIRLGTVIFSMEQGVLGCCREGASMVEERGEKPGGETDSKSNSKSNS